ncbi:SGNH/GDSL hydrolase family protein [archaeon]|jgi:lysophospholipase L1-like esterase|nr:SGNH/GDSL hydrolase family protein [Candidatus Woesearchaeota archaeon]MBT3721339.1 SGNH/GDSL hydrolase family protein [archaeon]MBT4022070.1 SGNH/GDSL hydrolase family protein [archaeon]MBT4272683.1 SGNH/GDSL hydrolase family protein [archaeon]MBT4461482.1 SGNH/GDSL hydrolase family protein [archaeon]
MHKKKKIYGLIVSVAAFILCLLFFEIVLRLTYPLYANYNTEMWKYASKMKQISYGDSCHSHLPETSMNLYGAKITINSQGLRSEYNYSIEKTKKRVILLGDSITLGWGVQNNETFSKVLENYLGENYEVINAGVGNYNTYCEYFSLKKYSYLNPDLIIVGFYLNDFEQIKYPSKISYFFIKNSYIYSFFFDKLSSIPRGHYVDFYKKNFENSNNQKIVEDSLHKISVYAKEKNIPLVLANFPEFHKFEEYEFYEINNYLEFLSKENDIQYIDLLEAFENVDPKSLRISNEDYHPNAKGHKIIAKFIYEKIHLE